MEFGNQEDLTEADEELERAFKDRLTLASITKEGNDFCFAKQHSL